MENMLRSFDYALEYLENESEYEFDESSEEELEVDEPTETITERVNPMWFIPDRYYAYIEKSYILMVETLKHNSTPTVNMIIAADPTFQDGEDAYLVNYQVVLRKWKKLAEQLQLCGEFRLCNKRSPTLRLPWFEEWGHIVRIVHEEGHRSGKQCNCSIDKTEGLGGRATIAWNSMGIHQRIHTSMSTLRI
jgi:hypothetical protein